MPGFLSNFPIGSVALFIVGLLIYLGLAHRILDRMRLSDRAALLVVGAILIGGLIDIPIMRGAVAFTINVGGALVPIGLAIYVLSQAGTGKETSRAIISILLTAVAVYVVSKLRFGSNPRDMVLDPLYLVPIVAGLVAYISGRSRRSAFIAGTLGVILYQLIWFVPRAAAGMPTTLDLGGAGEFDAIVISGLLATLLAEIIGEGREFIQGGQYEGADRPHREEVLNPPNAREGSEGIESKGGEEHDE